MFRAGIFNYANCKLAAISAHVLTAHARVTWSIQFWDNLTPRFPDPHLPIHFLPFNVTRSCLKPVFYAICCNLCTFPVWHPNMGIAHALYYVNCAWGGTKIESIFRIPAHNFPIHYATKGCYVCSVLILIAKIFSVLPKKVKFLRFSAKIRSKSKNVSGWPSNGNTLREKTSCRLTYRSWKSMLGCD